MIKEKHNRTNQPAGDPDGCQEGDGKRTESTNKRVHLGDKVNTPRRKKRTRCPETLFLAIVIEGMQTGILSW